MKLSKIELHYDETGAHEVQAPKPDNPFGIILHILDADGLPKEPVGFMGDLKMVSEILTLLKQLRMIQIAEFMELHAISYTATNVHQSPSEFHTILGIIRQLYSPTETLEESFYNAPSEPEEFESLTCEEIALGGVTENGEASILSLSCEEIFGKLPDNIPIDETYHPDNVIIDPMFRTKYLRDEDVSGES